MLRVVAVALADVVVELVGLVVHRRGVPLDELLGGHFGLAGLVEPAGAGLFQQPVEVRARRAGRGPHAVAAVLRRQPRQRPEHLVRLAERAVFGRLGVERYRQLVREHGLGEVERLVHAAQLVVRGRAQRGARLPGARGDIGFAPVRLRLAALHRLELHLVLFLPQQLLVGAQPLVVALQPFLFLREAAVVGLQARDLRLQRDGVDGVALRLLRRQRRVGLLQARVLVRYPVVQRLQVRVRALQLRVVGFEALYLPLHLLVVLEDVLDVLFGLVGRELVCRLANVVEVVAHLAEVRHFGEQRRAGGRVGARRLHAFRLGAARGGGDLADGERRALQLAPLRNEIENRLLRLVALGGALRLFRPRLPLRTQRAVLREAVAQVVRQAFRFSLRVLRLGVRPRPRAQVDLQIAQLVVELGFYRRHRLVHGVHFELAPLCRLALRHVGENVREHETLFPFGRVRRQLFQLLQPAGEHVGFERVGFVGRFVALAGEAHDHQRRFGRVFGAVFLRQRVLHLAPLADFPPGVEAPDLEIGRVGGDVEVAEQARHRAAQIFFGLRPRPQQRARQLVVGFRYQLIERGFLQLALVGAAWVAEADHLHLVVNRRV